MKTKTYSVEVVARYRTQIAVEAENEIEAKNMTLELGKTAGVAIGTPECLSLEVCSVRSMGHGK